MLVLLTRLSDHFAKIIPLWGKRTALSAINKNQLNIIGNLAYCRKKCLAATNLPIHAWPCVLMSQQFNFAGHYIRQLYVKLAIVNSGLVTQYFLNQAPNKEQRVRFFMHQSLKEKVGTHLEYLILSEHMRIVFQQKGLGLFITSY